KQTVLAVAWYGRDERSVQERKCTALASARSKCGPAIRSRGTLEDWQARVAKLVAGNTRLELALSAAVAVAKARCRSTASSPIPGDSTMCTATCWSGRRIAGTRATLATLATAAHERQAIAAGG